MRINMLLMFCQYKSYSSAHISSSSYGPQSWYKKTQLILVLSFVSISIFEIKVLRVKTNLHFAIQLLDH